MKSRTIHSIPNNSKRVFLIRHAHALHGDKTTMDPELTELGNEQIVYLKEYFQDINMDEIVTSELKRSKQTAKALDPLGIINTREDADFNEAHTVGDWRKYSTDDATKLANLSLFYPDDKVEIGESIRMIRIRLKKAWERIVDSDGKNIAIVSHNGVISLLIAYLFGIEEGDQSPITIRHYNTAISEILILDTKNDLKLPDYTYKIHYLCNHSHIPSRLLTY
ncbi:histidine phosphatase family protein [Bacillus sp. E(2018)]|uniref:histidine phosphatase family protein n=1 Tax=Bacillus sp. E(2018) TaxID=2502239 RepID=UPI0014854380|nr:histidine phosphatase family protein [Bacillus sp. E(2018)]